MMVDEVIILPRQVSFFESPASGLVHFWVHNSQLAITEWSQWAIVQLIFGPELLAHFVSYFHWKHPFNMLSTSYLLDELFVIWFFIFVFHGEMEK